MGFRHMKLDELFSDFSYLDEVLVSQDGSKFELLREGKWISGRFDRNIRIDRPTHLHGAGQDHGHVFGRKGDELGVVNFDGTSSHGTRMKLHDRDADALRLHGFDIRMDNIVEWLVLSTSSKPILLLG
jgi:hypothetical protein